MMLAIGLVFTPEHPAAVEGCRPVSRGLMLELVTVAKITFTLRNVNTKGGILSTVYN
jgi:hypothetical protein